jgi:hypothetical protein
MTPAVASDDPSPAQSSSSSDENQRAYTYQTEETGSYRTSESEPSSPSGDGSNCTSSGGAEWTVTTDEGTTHHSSAGTPTCSAPAGVPAPAPAAQVSDYYRPAQASAPPSPLPQEVQAVAPEPVPASPEITVQRSVSAPIETVATDRQGARVVGVALIALVLLLATAGVLVLFHRKGRLRHRAGAHRPSRAVTATEVPGIAPVVPLAPRASRTTTHPTGPAYVAGGWLPVPATAGAVSTFARTGERPLGRATQAHALAIAPSVRTTEADVIVMFPADRSATA